jgi:hypothetical protein
VAPATLNRRLAYIKKNDATLYKHLFKKDSRTKLYDDDKLLPVLKDWSGYIARLEATPTVVAAGPKARKARTPEPAAHKPHTRPAPPPPDPDRAEKLNRLLEAPTILTPSPEALALFTEIDDPRIRERVEYAIVICDTYSRGEVTLEQACTEAGIPARTFRDWMHMHAEIAALYKRARKQHRKKRTQLVGEAAHDSLLRNIRAEEWDEETVMYKQRLEPDGTFTKIAVGSKTVRKRREASAPLIMFALTNVLDKLYKNKILPEAGPSADQQAKDEIDKMSPEQKMAELQRMMKERLEQQLLEQGWTPPPSTP